MLPADYVGRDYLLVDYQREQEFQIGDKIASYTTETQTIQLLGKCPPGGGGSGPNGIDCDFGYVDYDNDKSMKVIAHEFGHAFGLGHDGVDGQCSGGNTGGLMAAGHDKDSGMLEGYCDFADFVSCDGECSLPLEWDTVRVDFQAEGLEGEVAQVGLTYNHREENYYNNFGITDGTLLGSHVPKCASVSVDAQKSNGGKSPHPPGRYWSSVEFDKYVLFQYECTDGAAVGSDFISPTGPGRGDGRDGGGNNNLDNCGPDVTIPYEGPFAHLLGLNELCLQTLDFCHHLNALPTPKLWDDLGEPEENITVTEGCPPGWQDLDGCNTGEVVNSDESVMYIPDGSDIHGPVVGLKGAWPRQFSGTMQLEGIAASEHGQTDMLFFIDDELVQPNSLALGNEFSAELPIEALPQGEHELTVVAVDSRQGPNYATIWKRTFTTLQGTYPDIAFVKSWNSENIANNETFNYGSYSVDEMYQSRYLLICNSGAVNLNLQSAQAMGSAFYRVGSPPQTNIAPGNCTNYWVRFDANSPGQYSGEIRLQSNDPDENPFVVPLMGTVVADTGDTEPPTMFLDSPVTDAQLSGQYPSFGWAVDESGVQSVSYEMDGNAISLQAFSYGGLRQDVCDAINVNDPNCPNVGFGGSIDTTQFNNGAHTLTVLARDPHGNERRQNIPVSVDNSTGPQVLVYDSFNGGSTGAPLNGRQTPTGSQVWQATPVTRFYEGKVTVQGTPANPHGAISFRPSDHGDRPAEVEAKLNPSGGNDWIALGFTTHAAHGWWSDGQVWLWLNANGNFNVMANGTAYSLTGGIQAIPGQPSAGAHQVKLRYDPLNGRVSAWLNGFQVLNNVNLPASFSPDVRFVGFSGLHAGENQSTFDNFKVTLD